VGGFSTFPVVTTGAAVACGLAGAVVTGDGDCGLDAAVVAAGVAGTVFAAGVALGERSITGAAVGVDPQAASSAIIASAVNSSHFRNNGEKVTPIPP
jgi:cysteine synthase